MEDKPAADFQPGVDAPDGDQKMAAKPPQSAPAPADVASSASSSKKMEVQAAPISPTEGRVAKKRSWKKPKDKPKRPLSGYNIFFQHMRVRIVEGFETEAEPDELVKSIEMILNKTKEKRRHRKTHGKISFGDLARSIADKWKSIRPESKAIFDHYAEVDMQRYKREVKIWKEKKEREGEMAMSGHSRSGSYSGNFPNTSFSSVDSASSSFNYEGMPTESMSSMDSAAMAWQARRMQHQSPNTSFSTLGSDAGTGYESLQVQQMMLREQQMKLEQQQRRLNQQLRYQQLQMEKERIQRQLNVMQQMAGEQVPMHNFSNDAVANMEMMGQDMQYGGARDQLMMAGLPMDQQPPSSIHMVSNHSDSGHYSTSFNASFNSNMNASFASAGGDFGSPVERQNRSLGGGGSYGFAAGASGPNQGMEGSGSGRNSDASGLEGQMHNMDLNFQGSRGGLPPMPPPY